MQEDLSRANNRPAACASSQRRDQVGDGAAIDTPAGSVPRRFADERCANSSSVNARPPCR